MNIIVTGSNGFIGKNLIPIIKKEFPNSKIYCLVRENQPNSEIIYEKVNYNDLESLKNLKILNEADYIFHLAGVTKGISKKDFIYGNINPTKNILESVKNNKNLQRFVFISSLAASGPSSSKKIYKNENDKNYPIEFYGEAKLEAEKIVKNYSSIIKTTIIRPSAVYGIHDVDFLNIFKMIKNNLSIYANNKNDLISIIHVKDLCDGILKAALSDKSIGETYFLSNDIPITWKNIYEIVSKKLNKNTIEINIPNFILNIIAIYGEIYSRVFQKKSLFNKQKIIMAKSKYWICSNQKAKNDFGFKADTNIHNGFNETIEWCKKNNKI